MRTLLKSMCYASLDSVVFPHFIIRLMCPLPAKEKKKRKVQKKNKKEIKQDEIKQKRNLNLTGKCAGHSDDVEFNKL